MNSVWLNLVPWAFSGVVIIAGAILALKVGVPGVKIAALEQHIKLIDLQQRTALERAELAEQRAVRLGEQLQEATEALKKANIKIAALLTVIELKDDWDEVKKAHFENAGLKNK